jgi:hypothetical protein
LKKISQNWIIWCSLFFLRTIWHNFHKGLKNLPSFFLNEKKPLKKKKVKRLGRGIKDFMLLHCQFSMVWFS